MTIIMASGMGIQRSDDGVTTDWPLNERQFTAAGRQVKIRKVRELNMAASTHHRIPLLGVRSKRHRLTRPPAIQHLDAPYCIATRQQVFIRKCTHARPLTGCIADLPRWASPAAGLARTRNGVWPWLEQIQTTETWSTLLTSAANIYHYL